MKEFLDFISIEPSTMIIAVLNLFVLCLILKKFLFNKVEGIIKKRKDEVDDVYNKADLSLKKNNEAKEQYEKRIENIQLERDKIIIEAKEEASVKAESILNESREASLRLKNETDKELILKKNKMYKGMKEEVADISVAIAEKIIESEIDKQKHKKLVDDFIDGLEIKDE